MYPLPDFFSIGQDKLFLNGRQKSLVGIISLTILGASHDQREKNARKSTKYKESCENLRTWVKLAEMGLFREKIVDEFENCPGMGETKTKEFEPESIKDFRNKTNEKRLILQCEPFFN